MFRLKSKPQHRSSNLLIFYEALTGISEVIFAFSLISFGQPLLNLYHQVIFSNSFIFSHESLADVLETIIPYIFDHYLFIALFFLIFGIVKIFCAIGLYHKKDWANHLLLLALILLLPFDITSLLQSFAFYKLAYFIIDSMIIYYLLRKNYTWILENK